MIDDVIISMGEWKELCKARDEIAHLRAELKDAYNAIHDMDNARLETQRLAQELLVTTGNAYKYPTPPEVKP
jgi:hypothetical protein